MPTSKPRAAKTAPVLTEDDRARFDAYITDLAALESVVPLHEMSEPERTAYANATWAKAGIIPDRPNAGRTISGPAK
jgi:hypothetical protein